MSNEKKLNTGIKAPDFNLKDSSGESVTLKQFSRKWLVLYFYPKDNTSGCTTEAIDFTGTLSAFKELNAAVVGISPDSCKSHQKFILKHDLLVTLLSDEDKVTLQNYGVWQLKKMYGKDYYGVIRTTFLIGPGGKIKHIWDNVKVAGHVEEVLSKLKEFQNK